MRNLPRRLPLAALVLATLAPHPALGEPHGRVAGKETLIEYIRSRDDLPPGERGRFEAEIRKRFGGSALKEDTETNVEIRVAKSILSTAIFMHVDPKKAVGAAWDGWHGALGFVPPPIAIHYEILKLQGRQPRGRPIDLAFKFPDFYSEEIAPDLVAYWETSLAAGKIPDDALTETKEALDATRLKMRPLLLDRLRVLARLDRDLKVAKGARRAEIEHDMKALDQELVRCFKGVARRPEVLDPRKRAFDRLRIQLEDMALKVSDEDRMLDPDAPPPPRREIPNTAPAEVKNDPNEPPLTEPNVRPEPPTRRPRTKHGPTKREEAPLTEPDEAPPSGPLPAQPRAGDPDPKLEKGERSLGELINAYRRRLEGTVEPWLGAPYVFGGMSRSSGVDCSGFTQTVFLEAYALELPRMSRDQYFAGRPVPFEALRPGDLVFFDPADTGQIGHVGVYAGDGRFVHASSSKGVVYEKLGEKYYKHAYRGARRLLVYPD